MKTIPLTQGFVALVDDQDYEVLRWRNWVAHVERGRVYAWSNTKRDGRWRMEKMHRLILGVTNPKIKIDHRDGNGLNNQRHNLREATQAQNLANSRPRSGSSRFKGVTFRSPDKWIAQISKDGKHTYLGIFRDEFDAATAYNFAAIEMFGEFARLNLP